jgi:hypothetical protein
VHAEDLRTDQSTKGHPIKCVLEGVPQANRLVSTIALLKEPVDSVDGGTFVIASQQEEILRVLDLKGITELNLLLKRLTL